MSVIWATMGMVVLPAEALWLFPGDESLYLGLALGIVGISQLICPAAGLVSDRHRSRWGRRRPFIFMGTLAAVVSIAGLWVSSVWRLPGLFFFFLFSSQTALNVVYAAQAAIVPDLYKSEKGEVSGMVSSLQLGGNLIGMFYVLCSAERDFHLTYGVYIVMLAVTGVLVCIASRERPTDKEPVKPFTWEAVRGSYWIDLEGERDFFWIFVGRTLFYMATAFQTFIYYYMRDLMKVGNEADIRSNLAVLALIATLIGLGASYPLGRMSDQIGRKILVYMACLCMGLAYAGYTICPLLGEKLGMHAVYMLGGLYGLGLGGYLSVDYALALDCLPEKHRGSSEALGLWGIAGFIGTSLGPMVGGVVLEATGGWGLGGHYGYHGYVILLLTGSSCCILAAYFTSLITKAK